jgi:hypothetical protein
MTTIINDNLFNLKDNKSGKKYQKPKQGRSTKLQRTHDYWLKMHNKERRKQTKVSYNHTHRREEQPDEKDLQLEGIHFANFLGIKDIKYIKYGGMPYNNTHINEPVNLCDCDMLRPEPESDNVSLDSLTRRAEEMDQTSEDGDDSYNYGSWANQISREPNAKWDMRWIYEPETQTLTGYSTFKRCLDEDAEKQPNKRAKEQDRETAIFESMVAYMKEQLELAQAMIDDELYPCDCHK